MSENNSIAIIDKQTVTNAQEILRCNKTTH